MKNSRKKTSYYSDSIEAREELKKVRKRYGTVEQEYRKWIKKRNLERERQKEVVLLRKRGHSLASIARILKCSRERIRGVLREAESYD